jgi:NAD(P)H-hydrate epimerase
MSETRAILAEEMAAIEWNADYLGVSRLLMMENAGQAVAAEIMRRQKGLFSVAIFAGLGGNGGDGFVTARHLAAHYRCVHVILMGDPSTIRSPEAAVNWRILEKMRHSVRISVVHDSAELPNVTEDVVVDALLGTGTTGSPRPPIPQALQLMNRLAGFKVAVDLPSGIHPNTGEPTTEAAFRADVTVTFHRAKTGLLKAKPFVGKLLVADIGVPPEAELYVGPGDVLRATPPRAPYTKKGDFGRLLVVGGSSQYTGAPILASLGALRSGVDLVQLAAPSNVIAAATSQSADLIPVPLQDKLLTKADLPVLEPVFANADTVLIGPGLGTHNETLDAIGELFTLATKHGKPVVIDADALKVISRVMKLGPNAVITPHAGEFQRIAGYGVEEALSQRAEAVRELAKMLQCVVLLKGPVDVISTPTDTRFNWTGTPAMSVGGTGDVLAGLVAGFRAQGVGSFLSACVSAFVNGAAGMVAFRSKGTGLIASDLLEYAPQVLANPMTAPVAYHTPIPVGT